MNAEGYNRIRRIIFCAANDPKKGFETAHKWLEESYKEKLGIASYTGLKAELYFYQRHRREFGLTVAADAGEHADFSGMLSSEICRFDVTTNLDYKKFSTYEPYMAHGPKYKIVLIDKDNYEITDIVSLAFERCNCGGYLIPFILLKRENFNNKGESQWSHDQLHMRVCTSCASYQVIDTYTTHFMIQPSEYVENLPEELTENEVAYETNSYSLHAFKYLRRKVDDSIMALGEFNYRITRPDGDGFWTSDLPFINQVVADDFPKDLDLTDLIYD